MQEKSKKTILLADDEEIIVRPFQEIFERKGYFVLTARDGEEAFDIIRSAQIDVVVADLKMPKLSGIELIQKTKELFPHLPIVMLSGMGTISEAIGAIKLGAFDYIQKPVTSVDAFELTVIRAIERGELEKNQEILQKNLQEKTRKLEEKIVEINQAKLELEKQSYYLQRAFEMIEQQNLQMEEDLKNAQRIQEELLPKNLPSTDQFSFAARYIPSGKVGGDIYGAFYADDNNINFYIADVAGHGVGAAMVTVFLKKTITPFQQFTDMTESPKEILTIINSELMKAGFGRMLFVTMLFATFNIPSRKLTFSSAGHLPFIVKSPGRPAEFVSAKGISLGWLQNPEFGESSISLNPGERLLFYTDGVIDSINKETQAPLGQEGLARIMSDEQYHSLAPQQMVDEVLDKVVHCCELKDDVSILALAL